MPRGIPNDKTASIIEDEDGKVLVEDLYLHSSVMIDGRNETHLNSRKVPTIRAMYWVNNYSAILIEAKKNHILPSAAVKDSIL